MNRKIMKFGYEDTDQKIEIDLYGLVFEINKERILNKDINSVNSNDEENIKDEIEDILGKGTIEKINNKRISDGYNEMTLDVEVAVLTCIYKTYIEFTTGQMIDGINNSNNKMLNEAQNMSNYNRQDRRYNRNNFRRNNGRYRRY